MLKQLGRRLSYANVMATIAVFVALGGSSYAAVSLGRNAVKNRNIAPNAVTSGKVKNGSLLSKDFKAGQLPKGDKGDTGAKGNTGAKGDTGTPAVVKLTSLHYSSTDTSAAPTGTFTKVRDLGDFTKSSASTAIRLTWNAHARTDGAAGQFCQYTLRIDGADNTGNTSTTYNFDADGQVVLYIGAGAAAESPLSSTVVFNSLAAGAHTVSVWNRGSATTACQLNHGNFGQTLYVEEVAV